MTDRIPQSLGGILGFYCAHSYIHFYEGPWSASSVLKGVDKALYETFRNLKLKPEIRVILDPDQICHDYSDGPLDEDPPDEYPDDEGGDHTPGRSYRVSVIHDEDIEDMDESLVPSFVVDGRPQPPVLAIADDATHDEDVRRVPHIPPCVSALTTRHSSTSRAYGVTRSYEGSDGLQNPSTMSWLASGYR